MSQRSDECDSVTSGPGRADVRREGVFEPEAERRRPLASGVGLVSTGVSSLRFANFDESAVDVV